MLFGQKNIGSVGEESWIQTNKNNENKKRMEKRFDLHSSSLGLEEGNVSSMSTSKIRKTEDNKSSTLMTLYEQHQWCHQMAWDGRQLLYLKNVITCSYWRIEEVAHVQYILCPAKNTGKPVEFEYLSTFGQPHVYIYIYIQSQYPLPKEDSGRCLYDFLGCFCWVLICIPICFYPTNIAIGPAFEAFVIQMP